MNYFTIWVSNCWLLILDKVPPRGPREARAPGAAWRSQAARTGLMKPGSDEVRGLSLR